MVSGAYLGWRWWRRVPLSKLPSTDGPSSWCKPRGFPGRRRTFPVRSADIHLKLFRSIIARCHHFIRGFDSTTVAILTLKSKRHSLGVAVADADILHRNRHIVGLLIFDVPVERWNAVDPAANSVTAKTIIF